MVRRNIFYSKFFLALLVSGGMFIFAWWQPNFLVRPLQFVTTTVIWPLQNVFAPVAFEIQDFRAFLASIGEYKRLSEELQKENIRLERENAELRDIKTENQELRRELSLLPRNEYELRGATVIGRDISGLGNALEVNQGTQAGLEVGMPVIVEAGVLIGRVSDVTPFSARVELLSYAESIINAVTLDTRAEGVVRGEHGLGIVYDMVPQSETLQNGDTVVTSGLGDVMPPGLLVGTLQDVRLTDDKLFQRGTIKSPVRFDRLRHVFIVMSKK